MQAHSNIDHQLCIKDLWVHNSWDTYHLMELIGAEKASEICHNIAASRLGDDLLVWMPSRDGHFHLRVLGI